MEVKVGDIVKYASEFLRNTGQYSGPVPFMEGTVLSVYGDPPIVEVDWGDHRSRAMASNLWPKNKLHLEPR